MTFSYCTCSVINEGQARPKLVDCLEGKTKVNSQSYWQNLREAHHSLQTLMKMGPVRLTQFSHEMRDYQWHVRCTHSLTFKKNVLDNLGKLTAYVLSECPMFPDPSTHSGKHNITMVRPNIISPQLPLALSFKSS